MSAQPSSAPATEGGGFSRRERQLMDIVYRLGQATAAEIHRELPDAPTYTAVRGLLRVLVEKGHLEVERDGLRYVYRQRTSREAAGASLLTHVVRTFFDGSAAKAMAALVGSPRTKLSAAEIEELGRLIERAQASEEEA